MLNLTSIACRSAGGRGTFLFGLAACLCFGCPGVEPTADGSGGESGDGGAPPSTGGRDNGGGGATSGGSSMGGKNAGGAGGCDADLQNEIDNCGECGRECLHDDTVKVPRCIDGVCQSFCESGFVNITMPATGMDDGCEAPGRRAFVTDDEMIASEVGGVSGADTLCQSLADSLKLGGSWAAWLSEQDASSSPSVRFNHTPDAPYMLLDFTPIAESWAVLLGANAGMLDHEIDLSETMMPATNQFVNVWTGTTPSGLPTGSHCSQWTGEGKEPEGSVGNVGQLTPDWTEEATPLACDGLARLYCFEQ